MTDSSYNDNPPAFALAMTDGTVAVLHCLPDNVLSEDSLLQDGGKQENKKDDEDDNDENDADIVVGNDDDNDDSRVILWGLEHRCNQFRFAQPCIGMSLMEGDRDTDWYWDWDCFWNGRNENEDKNRDGNDYDDDGRSRTMSNDCKGDDELLGCDDKMDVDRTVRHNRKYCHQRRLACCMRGGTVYLLPVVSSYHNSYDRLHKRPKDNHPLDQYNRNYDPFGEDLMEKDRTIVRYRIPTDWDDDAGQWLDYVQGFTAGFVRIETGIAAVGKKGKNPFIRLPLLFHTRPGGTIDIHSCVLPPPPSY